MRNDSKSWKIHEWLSTLATELRVDMFDIPHLVSLHLVCPFRCWVSRLEDGAFDELFVSFPCCFEIVLKLRCLVTWHSKETISPGEGTKGYFFSRGGGTTFSTFLSKFVLLLLMPLRKHSCYWNNYLQSTVHFASKANFCNKLLA